MPSIVSLAYEPYWKKRQQLITIAQNDTMKDISKLTAQAQREAAAEGAQQGGNFGLA